MLKLGEEVEKTGIGKPSVRTDVCNQVCPTLYPRPKGCGLQQNYDFGVTSQKKELRLMMLVLGDQTELCTHVARAQPQVNCSTSNCAAS